MKRITKITRGYKSFVDRKRAVTQLAKRGFNHFVYYKDTQAEFALCYGKASYPTPGTISIQW